jgi:hypothetical protein
MFCTKCGNRIQERQSFCTKCGNTNISQYHTQFAFSAIKEANGKKKLLYWFAAIPFITAITSYLAVLFVSKIWNLIHNERLTGFLFVSIILAIVAITFVIFNKTSVAMILTSIALTHYVIGVIVAFFSNVPPEGLAEIKSIFGDLTAMSAFAVSISIWRDKRRRK